MDTSPPAPPPQHGALIEIARKGARLSVQAAADQAGIAKATWIDSVRGFRKRGGEWEPVNPKAETIAGMADAVGVSPERLETEGGHPVAAAVLREMHRQGHGASPDPWEEARPQGWPNSEITPEFVEAAARNWLPPYRARVNALKAAGNPDPSGEEIFGPDDTGAIGGYEAVRLTGRSVYDAVWYVALMKERNERARGRQGGPRHGSAGA